MYTSKSDKSEIDLDKKLVSEFALYYVQKNRRNSDELAPTLNDLLKLEPGSKEWYELMLEILESINTTGMNQLARENKNSFPNSKRARSSTNTAGTDNFSKSSNRAADATDDTKEVLQELTSFLMSNSIQKGIDIKPIPLDDPVNS